ncbi:LexA family protein [Halomonas sp. GXIMD04776]|uniref:LexA family protein n=1 Tax=Halomonas sp. GXIMD04776 TaxID=3415605 RepID=UPI003CB316A3
MGISHFADTLSHTAMPLSQSVERRGASGFPSPADDYQEAPLDLNQHLIPHPASTFFMRITGNNLKSVGFHDGDLLIVDRSCTAAAGHWVVAVIDGELALYQLEGQGSRWWLRGGDNRQARLPLEDHNDCRLWGLVCHVIHDCSRTG